MADHRRLLAALLLLGDAALAAEPLPTGFGPLRLGDPWDAVANSGRVKELSRATSDWERRMHACGYRSARISRGDDHLLVVAQDFRITELTRVSRLPAGSDPVAVARQFRARHGEPAAIVLRDARGAVTGDPSRARHVTLVYPAPSPAELTVSGAPLWQIGLHLAAPDRRRLENRSARCARGRAAREPGS